MHDWTPPQQQDTRDAHNSLRASHTTVVYQETEGGKAGGCHACDDEILPCCGPMLRDLVFGVGILSVSLVGNVRDNFPHIPRWIRSVLMLKHFLLAPLLSRMAHVHVFVGLVVQVFVLVGVDWVAHLVGLKIDRNWTNAQNVILTTRRKSASEWGGLLSGHEMGYFWWSLASGLVVATHFSLRSLRFVSVG